MNTFLSKFVKAFISGGVSAVAASLAVGVSFHSLEEAKHAGIVLVIAFANGAFHAIYNVYFPTPAAQQ